MGEHEFPRTVIGGLSVSRMIIGTNNVLGGSHRTEARDIHIKGIFQGKEEVARLLEAYLSHGVDTIIGCLINAPHVLDGIKLAEDRTGRKMHYIELGVFDVSDTPQARKNAEDFIRRCARAGCEVFLPLHVCVEELLNKLTHKIERIEDYLSMIRANGMIPGLSAHMPEVIQYADENEYDIETYIQIYNAIGFLMQVEIETVHHIIWEAKKPVLAIKPMAAGHLNPFVGLSFVWNTIRHQDMVATGCMTPEEAHEAVELSLAALEHRPPNVKGRLHQY
ncbi:MAG: hypothetical protein LBF63_07950 [Treponema sp.]|jgi:hypothetical protein|nr:hypothetical protein [Treponema sp.]